MRQAVAVSTDALSSLISTNQSYARNHRSDTPSTPSRHLAVVTCMDTRIDPLAVFGLTVGEAHILRNAGGRVTDDIRRSLALSTHVLGVRHVVLMQHTQCGLTDTDNEELRELTGTEIDFLPIVDHRSALEQDITDLKMQPGLSEVRLIAGWLFDVDSGLVEELARWEPS